MTLFLFSKQYINLNIRIGKSVRRGLDLDEGNYAYFMMRLAEFKESHSHKSTQLE